MSPYEWEALPWDMKRMYLDGMSREGLFGIPGTTPPVVNRSAPVRPDGRIARGTVAGMTRRTVTSKVRFPDGL